MDVVVPEEKVKGVEEYGYGYWMRFMLRHPEPMPEGKNQPWYFVSRLTRNNPHTDVAMGDRVLGVWLGADGYYFISMSDKTN